MGMGSGPIGQLIMAQSNGGEIVSFSCRSLWCAVLILAGHCWTKQQDKQAHGKACSMFGIWDLEFVCWGRGFNFTYPWV